MIIFEISLFLLPFSPYATAVSKKPIVFGDNSWDSIQVHNRIAGFVVKHGYGYPVDYVAGQFYNSIPRWQCTKHNSKKLNAYGLDKYFSDFMPGSDPALSGSMAAAYKKGQAWVDYFWSPTWVLGFYDMSPVEEPTYDSIVWKAARGCEYSHVDVNILVNSGLQKNSPEVFEFLRKYEKEDLLPFKKMICEYARHKSCLISYLSF